jgi:hypothetical protein
MPHGFRTTDELAVSDPPEDKRIDPNIASTMKRPLC